MIENNAYDESISKESDPSKRPEIASTSESLENVPSESEKKVTSDLTLAFLR